MAKPNFPGGIVANIADFAAPSINQFEGGLKSAEYWKAHGDYKQSQANASYRKAVRMSDPRAGVIDDNLLALANMGLVPTLACVNNALKAAKMVELTAEEFEKFCGE